MEKIRRVMWGRMERPATVFVPWDCGHHCPFCTTKAEYETKYHAEKLDYYFTRQKESLRRLLEYNFVDDVVFTGGEPLADIARLKELLGIVCAAENIDRRVYINTSFNFDASQEGMVYQFLVDESQRNRINGISVSLPYADVGMMNARGYAFLGRLMHTIAGHSPYNWVRINSVVKGNESAEQIRRFVKEVLSFGDENGFGVWSINLRKDYTECTQANLNDCHDPIMQTLMGMPDMPYKGGGGCLVCRNDVFWPNNDAMHRLTYHRGTENTSLRYGDLMIINDIVIKQDGEIRYDWTDGTPLPKCVMDALAERQHSDETEWKWKNPLFSHSLSRWGCVGEMTCRDLYSPQERCG